MRVRDEAFTLMEVLAAISIIAILIGLLVPSLSKAKAKATSLTCGNNLRQFALGETMYSDDRAGVFSSNKGGPSVPLGETWVKGWLDSNGSDNTNFNFLAESLLAPYLTLSNWRCPGDKSTVIMGGTIYRRSRSFAKNHFVGSPWTNENYVVFRTANQVTEITPSKLFLFADEASSSINDGTFAQPLSFDNNNPETWIFSDWPAVRHGSAGAVSFLDGHFEIKRWIDPRTRTGSGGGNNVDARWLHQRSTQQIIP